MNYVLTKSTSGRSNIYYFSDIDDSYALYKNLCLTNDIYKKLPNKYQKEFSNDFKPLAKVNEGLLKKVKVDITIDEPYLKKINKTTIKKKLEYDDENKIHLVSYYTYYYLKKDGNQDKVIYEIDTKASDLFDDELISQSFISFLLYEV